MKKILACFLFLNITIFGADINDEDINFNVLKALNLSNSKPDEAIKIYKNLYDRTGAGIYLKEAIKLATISKNSSLNELLKLGDEVLNGDSEFLKLKIMNYIRVQNFNAASVLAKELIDIEKNAKNYSLLGDTYYFSNEYDKALDSYERSYELNQSEENVLKISQVLLLKKKDAEKAIRYLQTHRKLIGCGKKVCDILAEIYKMRRDFQNFAEISEAAYVQKKENYYLDNAISAYLYIKNNDKVIELLKKYDYDAKLLIQIYAGMNKFDEAQRLAVKEFEKSGDNEFLGMDAIYEYEKNRGKITTEILKNVMAKFDPIIEKLNMPIYQNYYGYVLIDHDIDVKRGIKLVKKALENEPDSVYFLDSLAWGEYKLGKCNKAAKIMKKISDNEEFMKSDEAKEHLKAISECIKKAKK